MSQRWQPDSNQTVSGEPGAVQFANTACCLPYPQQFEIADRYIDPPKPGKAAWKAHRAIVGDNDTPPHRGTKHLERIMHKGWNLQA